MFILDQNSFGDATLDNVAQFVDFWSHFDNQTPNTYPANEPICYLDELHLNCDLTEENIRNLLRWKSPRHLTHVNQRGVPNQLVERAVVGMGTINQFRRHEITHERFLLFARGVFPTGVVYRAFLFHIGLPAEYPIWDQHVARVHALLTRRENDVGWSHYTEYCAWFAHLKGRLDINTEATGDNVQRAKRLDSALMAYGQFLLRYA